MAKIIIVEHMYIFFCDGDIFEQWSYSSDKEALAHAKKESEKRGKKVLVARWLEDDDTIDKE